jgi:two-component system LytT family response regulator
VDWLESAGNYVRLHVGARVHLVRATLSGLLLSLDPARFVRIHRSTIVNLDRVKVSGLD